MPTRKRKITARRMWRQIPGYEGFYEVSSDGLVRSLVQKLASGGHIHRTRILKPSTQFGYKTFGLYRNARMKICRAHRLVLSAFVGPCPTGHQGAHNNGIKDDNRLENLRWATPKENSADRIRHGTQSRGSSHGCAKLNTWDVRYIKSSKLHRNDLAKMFGVSKYTITSIRDGRTWTHLNPENGGLKLARKAAR